MLRPILFLDVYTDRADPVPQTLMSELTSRKKETIARKLHLIKLWKINIYTQCAKIVTLYTSFEHHSGRYHFTTSSPIQ